MRSCEEYAEIISCLIDGEVSNAEAEEVQAHIEHCESCRALFLAFSSVSDFLENELEEPPEGLTENIMSDIRRSRLAAVKTGKAMRRNLITAIASVAALAVICYTVPALSGLGNKAGGIALTNESSAVSKVYEAAAEESNDMLIPESAVMLSDSARFAAPAGASEDNRSFAEIISGESAEKLSGLISAAEPCGDEAMPGEYICIYNICIEESGKEYTLYCTGDSTFVRDASGGLAVIHNCGENVIGSLIG